MWVSRHKANLTRILPHRKPHRRPAFGRLQFEAPTPGRNPGHPAWERVGDADFLVGVPTRLSSSGRSYLDLCQFAEIPPFAVTRALPSSLHRDHRGR